MPLNLYRRHKRKCKGGHRQDSRNGEFEERRKAWKRCDCPIFASGILQGTFQRRSTECWEWDAANKVAQSWESSLPIPVTSSPTYSLPPSCPPLSPAQSDTDTANQDNTGGTASTSTAITSHTGEHRKAGSAPNPVKKPSTGNFQTYPNSIPEQNVPRMLTVKQAAALLGLGLTTTYRIIEKEPGVHYIRPPGSKKPIIRVESAVVERILKRSAVRISS